MTEKINATMILEIMGRPAEYIAEALGKLIDKMDGEEGNKVLTKEIHEPKMMEKGELFTTYAEINMEFDGWEKLYAYMFNYMPAHVEINSPATMKFQLGDYNNFINAVLRKLHDYDSMAKAFIIEKDNTDKEIAELKKKLGDLIEEKAMKKETKKKSVSSS